MTENSHTVVNVNGHSPLSSARLIGVLGDTHGDLEHVLAVSTTMWKRGVDTLLVLGDFGFVWPGRNWSADLNKLNRRLDQKGQVLYWVDGNHEDFSTLYSRFAESDDGLRRIRSNIIHLPRGYRTTLPSGKSLAVLGGANSVDRHLRSEGDDWWPEESITDDDLEALGPDHADILVGHDAPSPLPDLDTGLAETDRSWPPEMLEYSAAGRRKFQQGFLQVRPRLYFGGHYHQFVDQTVEYGIGDEAFACRVVLLDMNGSETLSQGILNVNTLKLDVFARRDTGVSELTGSEVGRWRVTTQGCTHVFDFGAWTVERIPGPDAHAMYDDGVQSMRVIETCRVGERGSWTIRSQDDLFDYYRHSSSVIRSIERLPDGE